MPDAPAGMRHALTACQGGDVGARCPGATIPRRTAPVAQLDRASVYGTEGQRFESSRARSARRPLPSLVVGRGSDQSARRQAQKQRAREERLEREREAARDDDRRRRLAIGAAVLAALLAAAAIAAAVTTGGGGEREATGAPAAESIADVHGVGVNPADRSLYIATHTGLFRSPPATSTAVRVDGPEQDLMGFSVAGPDRFVASGHPGPGQGGPMGLGLLESRDRGRTWRSVSLAGSDLHLLRAMGDAVYAFDGRLRVSGDGGRTWQRRSAPEGLIDIAIDPGDGDRVLASTESGVRLSGDGGRTWAATSLRTPVLLAWGRRQRPAAIGGDGAVLTSADGGRTWGPAGTAGGQPAAFAGDADGALYVARPDGAVDWSTDGGRTWRPRSRN